MKKRISRFLNLSDQIVLTTETLSMQEFTDLNYDNKIYKLANCGFYFKTEKEELIMIFCVSSKLYVFLANVFYEVTENFYVVFNENGNSKLISLFQKDQKISMLEYIDDCENGSTIFYSEDKEDSNFGLWFKNVINSMERRKIFIENNSN
jgi:hypothetical protein